MIKIFLDEMSEKKRPPRPPPPNSNSVNDQIHKNNSVFDQKEKLHERGNKLSNLVTLTELHDPSKDYSETPEELW